MTASTSKSRWPRRVYGHGAEPDPRFSFANERTFLAWIRTALALSAGGVALEAFVDDQPELRRLVAATLILLGVVSSGGALLRWMASERALRTAQPLPAPVLAQVVGVGVAATGLLALLLAMR